ncbi:hypothetical protein PGT21_023673 [Puccinia graminis f. sp. tritici]|uniref:Uncharacterized protein n=1 Tax=Puccinia graminis f. sp. tritici TaxID=56615 RepID=A0A5B0QX83_PUCGR|nr:hypothetical protein PGT21_023673 [Puccinia graminis f. sp. tritici]
MHVRAACASWAEKTGTTSSMTTRHIGYPSRVHIKIHSDLGLCFLTLHQLALAFLHVSTTTTCRRPGFDLEPYSSTNIANFLNSRKNQRNSCALGLLLGTIRFSWNKQYPLSSTLLIHKSRSLQSFSSK